MLRRKYKHATFAFDGFLRMSMSNRLGQISKWKSQIYLNRIIITIISCCFWSVTNFDETARGPLRFIAIGNTGGLGSQCSVAASQYNMKNLCVENVWEFRNKHDSKKNYHDLSSFIYSESHNILTYTDEFVCSRSEKYIYFSSGSE